MISTGQCSTGDYIQRCLMLAPRTGPNTSAKSALSQAPVVRVTRVDFDVEVEEGAEVVRGQGLRIGVSVDRSKGKGS